MRRLGWTGLALIMALLSMIVVAYPDLMELRRSKIWQTDRVDASEAELHGARIFIDHGAAMIFPTLPDRAVVYLRLGVQGDPQALKDWLVCDIGLTDARGRKWLPLTSAAAPEIIDLLADGRAAGVSCSQSLARALPGTASLSDQAFLVPVDVLNELRVEFAGIMTRPDAVSLSFSPALRPPV